MSQTKRQLFWEIFRFLLVGGTATLVDYFVYYLFRQWILPPTLINSAAWDTVSLILATAFGFCVGLTVNWILSVRFVFLDVKDKEKSSSKKSFAVFALIGLVGLGITELGMNILVGVLPKFSLFSTTAFLGLPWSEWLAKVIMTCIVLVWNYVARKRLVFQ
ncbi:MAG: GtrA family protein [Clostridia bacterium]|nr:GtrA family protein [Clostridia bacterium]